MKRLGIVLAVGSVVLLSGCVADGYYRGNYYGRGGYGYYDDRGNDRDYGYSRERRDDRDRYDYDRRY